MDCFWQGIRMFQSLIGTVQQQYLLRFLFSLYPHFPYFSIFFSKKVGQPLHSKFPQSLDSTGFFIFAKIDSEVQRLFDCFLLFSALFHAVFVLEALILLGWRFNDFFYRIFNNLCFNQRKSSSPLTKNWSLFWISQSHPRSGLRRTSMSFTYILPPGR